MLNEPKFFWVRQFFITKENMSKGDFKTSWFFEMNAKKILLRKIGFPA